jgi:hypothetical protein
LIVNKPGFGESISGAILYDEPVWGIGNALHHATPHQA